MKLPQIGQRIGVVCGPGESARRNSGIVLAHVPNKSGQYDWGDYALVMMDSGKTKRCSGLNSGPGIGWHVV